MTMLTKKARYNRKAFTLVELMTATVVSIIVILGVAVVVSDSQKGFNTLYSKTYSDVIIDGYVARKTFDATIRKSTDDKFFIADDGTWIEVYYYEDGNSTAIDYYTRFTYAASNDPNSSAGELNIESGQLNPQETLSTGTVCGNVTACTFGINGQSAQMILTLSDGLQTVYVSTSAFFHNQ